MNQVVKVSISRSAFTLEEEAYKALKSYIDKLRNYYASQEGGKEIVDDIEERIAELLNERTDNGARVVSRAQIDQVLAIMGTPEMIEDQDSANNAQPNYDASDTERPRHRLYRDCEHRVFGGVCSGLAAYWNWDTAWVRVLFVLATLFSGLFVHFTFWGHGGGLAGWTVLAYFVLWICVPKAVTVEERCAMRGAPVTARGIEHQAQSSTGSRTDRSPRYTVDERQHDGAHVLNVIFRVFAILIGLFFLLIGSVVLIALIAALCGVGIALGTVLPVGLLSVVAFAGNVWLLNVMLMLVIGLPVVGLLYLGCRLLFRLKGHGWIGLTLFLVWLASVVGLMIVGAQGFRQMSRKATYENRVDLPLSQDTLYVDMISSSSMPDDRYFLETGASEYKLGWIEGDRKDVQVVLFPALDLVRQSSQDPTQLKITSYGFGRSHGTAEITAQNNQPSYRFEGNVLTVQAQQASKENRWTGAVGELTLYVPSDCTVIVRKPIDHEFGKTPSRSVHKFGGWGDKDDYDFKADFDFDWDWDWD